MASVDPAGRRPGAEALLDAVAELSSSRTMAEVQRTLSRATRRLFGADGSAVVTVDGSFGHYVEEEGVTPGWKGRRIPLDGCVAGWCVTRRRPVVVDDVRADTRTQVAAYWSTPVTTLVMVPVRSRQPIGAVACYWQERRSPGEAEVSLLQTLADSAALAIENITLKATVEVRVGQRTAELEELNRRLQLEVVERKRAEEEVRRLSLVDELTGLYNRRGFTLLAGREMKSIKRSGRRALVLYIDIDGLKEANDRHGHEAGDRLLTQAATVLRTVTREVDVAARMGGDEFAVFMTLGFDPPPVQLIVERFLETARVHGVKWSIGATATPSDRQVTLDDLLGLADQAMYRERRTRRRAARAS